MQFTSLFTIKHPCLPAGIANKMVLDPLFSIMSQVIKPAMPALQVASPIVFNYDEARELLDIAYKATVIPYAIPLEKGHVGIFEAGEVTNQLITALSEGIREDKRAEVAIYVYGGNSDVIKAARSKFEEAGFMVVSAIDTRFTEATVVYSQNQPLKVPDQVKVTYINLNSQSLNDIVMARFVVTLIFARSIVSALEERGIKVSDNMKGLLEQADNAGTVYDIREISIEHLRDLLAVQQAA
jgi:hypothetical protein